MRPGVRCTPFGCAHGAPFGNASPWRPERAIAGNEMERHGQVAASLAYGGAAAAAVVAVGAAVGGTQALLGVSEPVWLTSLEALLGVPSAGVGLVLALLACLDMRRVG
mmetsp:Transcript_25588/g.73860  ORF Transcript_25588/g.73860 Transcript_25588/m.73860 type:complete len:108 (+) Transcript_25588:452-775(+)